jgi:hypothetical protein
MTLRAPSPERPAFSGLGGGAFSLGPGCDRSFDMNALQVHAQVQPVVDFQHIL